METEDERIDKQYYIDTYGKVVKIKNNQTDEIVSIHYAIAKENFPELEYPEDFVMEKLGWIKIGSLGGPPVSIKKEPTQAQINKLDILGLYNMLHI